MTIIERDILTVKRGVIAHQVNAKGVMGTGLAYRIAKKWPKVYMEYLEAYRDEMLSLGKVTMTQVNRSKTDPLFVANLVGQDTFWGVRRNTDYQALEDALWRVHDYCKGVHPLYLPYGMGCGLAGGDWKIVSEIIDRAAPEAIVCKLQ